MTNETEMTYKVTKHLVVQDINDEAAIVWNRFMPSILKLNRKAVDFITSIPETGVTESEIGQGNLEMLLKYRILYPGNTDPYFDLFKNEIERSLDHVDKKSSKQLAERYPYSQLTITNDVCNLGCSYCINEHKSTHKPNNYTYEEKLKIINDCVDQFLTRCVATKQPSTKISFNGGEILIEWKLLKEVIERIAQTYPIEIEYTINTNMTLMTEEIAQFMEKYKFKVFISIDGYKEFHDKTRVYKNGRGSFDDIIKGLNIFRKNNSYPLAGFQGTIDDIDTFDPNQVYKMEEYGFIEARLAPNLIDITKENAEKKADLMVQFLELNKEHNLKVIETYYENMKKLINQDKYFFFFSCKGVSCFPDMGLVLNISTMKLHNNESFMVEIFKDRKSVV